MTKRHGKMGESSRMRTKHRPRRTSSARLFQEQTADPYFFSSDNHTVCQATNGAEIASERHYTYAIVQLRLARIQKMCVAYAVRWFVVASGVFLLRLAQGPYIGYTYAIVQMAAA